MIPATTSLLIQWIVIVIGWALQGYVTYRSVRNWKQSDRGAAEAAENLREAREVLRVAVAIRILREEEAAAVPPTVQ